MTRTAWLLFGWLGFSSGLAAQSVAPALAFDALHKQIAARAGQTNAVVSFTLTNVSTAPVVIRDVLLSCGCSVASIPSGPWRLKAGEQGQVTVTTDVLGKRGASEVRFQLSVPHPIHYPLPMTT